MADKMFDRMDRAAARAYKNTNTRLGFGTDPALERYRKMTPTDFQTIASRYGPDGLIRYVQTMESRAIKGGRNGAK